MFELGGIDFTPVTGVVFGVTPNFLMTLVFVSVITFFDGVFRLTLNLLLVSVFTVVLVILKDENFFSTKNHWPKPKMTGTH